MARIPLNKLTPSQQHAREVYNAARKALQKYVMYFGMADKTDQPILGPITQALDNLCKRFGEEVA